MSHWLGGVTTLGFVTVIASQIVSHLHWMRPGSISEQASHKLALRIALIGTSIAVIATTGVVIAYVKHLS